MQLVGSCVANMKGVTDMGAYGLTDIGKARNQNQDAFAIVEENDATLVVVADGIGGHQAGDVASKLACNLLMTYFKNLYDHNPEKWFKQSLKKVNKIVFEEANNSVNLKGMGTTIVAAIITEDDVWILNVGDSRAYYLTKADMLIKITEDHSLANDLVVKEGMSPEQARELGKHIITRAVGIWPKVEGDIYQLTDKYKALLLCSDGLHNYVAPNEIIKILTSAKSNDEKCKQLINKANSAGGFDNITAVIVDGE